MAQQQQIFLYLLHTDFFPQGAVQGDIEKRFLPHILDYLLVKGVKTQPPPYMSLCLIHLFHPFLSDKLS